MNRILYSIFAILLLISPLQAGQDSDTKTTVLPNGLRIIVHERREVNLAAVDVWVRTGSVNETEETSGITHFIEHTAFKRTKNYGPSEIDRTIEGVGAEINAATSRDWIHFYTTTASEHLPTALNVLSDVVMNPLFNEDDVDKERLVILDELAKMDSDPAYLAQSMFAKSIFGGHPYSLPPAGTAASIGSITAKELLDYYGRTFNPQSTIVVIDGDVYSDFAIAEVERAFSDWTPLVQPVLRPDPPAPEPIMTPRVERYQASINQAYVVLGFIAPGAHDLKEMCAFDLLLAMTGNTYQGRIASALNSKGIRFSRITSDYNPQKLPSAIKVTVAVDPRDTDKVAPALLTEFVRLTREAPAETELSAAKRTVIGGDMYDQETFSGQARVIGLYECIGTYRYAFDYSGTVGSITARDVNAIASKYIGENNYSLVILEPGQAVSE